jgi:hypothetical protein
MDFALELFLIIFSLDIHLKTGSYPFIAGSDDEVIPN